jgi:Arylsulfotransferase (ASST)
MRRRWGSVAFSGNGLPTKSPTGRFPVAPLDDAFSYIQPGLALAAHRVSGSFSDRPLPRRRPACLPDRPLGVTLDGVLIHPAADGAGRDAVAREVSDSCGGRPSREGLYYYRTLGPCSSRRAGPRRHSPLFGYARDGFPISGRRGLGGKTLRNTDLDECHGHTHRLRLGRRVSRIYHYHQTAEFPYLIGCLRGKPARNWRASKDSASGDRRSPVPEPASAGSPGEGLPSIMSDPPVRPAFDPDVRDYTTRCTGADDVRLSVDSPPGTTVSVDGQPAKAGGFSAEVALAAGQRYSIGVATSRREFSYHVRCLPSDFPAWTFTRSGLPSQEWYIATPTLLGGSPYIVLFDSSGVPVWWYRGTRPPLDGKLMPDGNLAWVRWYSGPFGTDPNQAYEVRKLDGSLVRTVQTVGVPTDNHELVQTTGGNYLLLSYVPRDGVDLSPWGGPSDATVLDAVVQEVSPAGALLWSWNSKDHIALSESERFFGLTVISEPAHLPDGRTAYDIVHPNAVEALANGSFLLSLRHTDAVYEISRPAGEVAWKLGGTTTAKSLAVAGDSHGTYPLGGPHDVRSLADGTITVHDNAVSLNRAPRAVRYQVNATARTAWLAEQVTDPQITNANCCGSARKLSGGGWLIGWGNNDLITEFDPDGNRVFSLSFGGPFSYRAVPVPTGALDREELRNGMDVMHPRP